MELTRDNYYSPENKHISNSKVSDFLKSKEYYYKKHVSQEIKRELTAPMKIGLMVDSIITGSPVPFERKVLKRDNPDLYEYQKTCDDSVFATDAQIDEAVARANAITKEPFFQEYAQKGAEFQVVLQGNVPHSSIPICGMADVITEARSKRNSKVFIDDFKSVSASKVKSVASWYWTCKEMGYFRQLAAYKNIYKQMHRQSKAEIICRHVVVSKLSEDLYKVNLFVIPPELLEDPWDEFCQTAIRIAHEKEWKDDPVIWRDAIQIVQPKADLIIMSDDE